MNHERYPAMSVILPTPDEFETIRRTVEALRAQTIADRLELVIVAPSADIRIDPPAVEGFASVQLVPVGSITTSNAARVAGIRAATAPIVALAEDHCFPRAEWAASLLAAYEEGCAAVGPVLRNANPATVVSWANFLAEYGCWIGKAGGPIDYLPGHNSSYRRGLLLEHGDNLISMMEAETVVQDALRRRGHRLLLAPAAQADHYNFSLWRSSVSLRFHGGRLFAGYRIQGWSRSRRIVYALGAPLIPLVRLHRILGFMGGPGGCRPSRWRLVPVLLALLIIDAAGELVGYLTGPGKAGSALAAIEFHRDHHMTRTDRNAYEAARPRLAPAPAGTSRGV